jgi:hypothetical protein
MVPWRVRHVVMWRCLLPGEDALASSSAAPLGGSGAGARPPGAARKGSRFVYGAGRRRIVAIFRPGRFSAPVPATP